MLLNETQQPLNMIIDPKQDIALLFDLNSIVTAQETRLLFNRVVKIRGKMRIIITPLAP